MRLSRVQIKNFRNFKSLNVPLVGNTVIIGENRVGKSNFLFALRLVLDLSLPDSARQLKSTDIWDGCTDLNSVVEIHLDFTDFDSDEAILALLTDFRLAEDHTIARLSYVYRKKPEITGDPNSESDYEFKVYGAGDEARGNIPNSVRNKICIELLHALRDAEAELGNWQNSPLRKLLDEAISKVPKEKMVEVAKAVSDATAQVTGLSPIQTLETSLTTKIATLTGPLHDVNAKFGISPTDPSRLFRSVRMLIDNGKRGIADASLGSANLVLLTLKLAESEWLRAKNDHNFTIMCIEEPEAHLHPHLQRTVFKKLFESSLDQPLSLFMTTHSPNIASVAQLNSIVLLKNENSNGTVGYSLANLTLEPEIMEDLQRYLDTTKAEILFAKGIIFVEGDAEEALMPVFSKSLGINLDDLGISICNVGGVNFDPYVRFAHSLSIPFCVITDWDPIPGKLPLGNSRLTSLLKINSEFCKEPVMTPEEIEELSKDDEKLKTKSQEAGIFCNESTLEIEIAQTPELGTVLLDVIQAQNFGTVRQKRIESWKNSETSIDGEQLLAIISDIGKGRLAGKLAIASVNLDPPEYIKAALTYISTHVQ